MQLKIFKIVPDKRIVFQCIALVSFCFIWGGCVKTTIDTNPPPSSLPSDANSQSNLSLSDARFNRNVQVIQNELIRKGYNPGPIDGILGRKTESALKAFQKENNHEVTGRADATTQKLLLSGKGIAFSKPAQQVPKVEEPVSVPPPVPNLTAEVEVKQEHAPLQIDGLAVKMGTVNEETSIMMTASIFSDTVIDVSPGIIIEILGKEKDFIEVQYKGMKGYIYSEYIDVNE